MQRLGARLGKQLDPAGADASVVVGLIGDLGAGKTTLVQGMFRGLGYGGRVKSPTYTLVEPYQVTGVSVLHVDLYRVSDAAELEYLAVDEHMSQPGLTFVEWPERAPAMLEAIDLKIDIEFMDDGRRLVLTAMTAVVAALASAAYDDIEGVTSS